MYLDSIRLENFRTFRSAEIALCHPDQDFHKMEIPRPKLANINLLLGNNGLGKSAFLKAVALAALGPFVGDAGVFPYRLVRREPGEDRARREKVPGAEARLKASFTAHAQDRVPGRVKRIESEIGIQRVEDIEKLRWTRSDEAQWRPIYQAYSAAFFFVGYGATRRVEREERVDTGARRASASVRAQRVQSLFEESYSLMPLTGWLPGIRESNPARYAQVQHLINRLMGVGHYRFTGEMEQREYLFEHKGLKVPFRALSDGYRAYIGWIGDLLYHVHTTCPKGTRLLSSRGIVMVDEVDLHLHPKWQMTVLPVLAKVLPNLQFIVTSHSPLVVGSLEWMNIIVMQPCPGQSSKPARVRTAVHGMDADQVLLTGLFGMESTRAPSKERRLKALTLRAGEGDLDAAKRLMKEMSRGIKTPA
jgi:predicted ATPase